MRRGRGAGLAGLAALLLVAVGRAQVQQEPSAETTEDTGIAISCSHPSIGTGDFIQWYRQLPGRSPAFITSGHKGSREVQDPPGRMSVAADRRSSALWLARPRRRDAAVYYCAEMLCDYGSGTGKLTFGSGTRLSIQTNVTPSPSVYKLISKDDEDLEMCLITDYSPGKLKGTDKQTSAVVEVTTSESKPEASYLSTYWAKKDKMWCGANHEGFGELEAEDPESGASTVCVTGISLHFRTDENLNMLSLSHLSLKIILMKVIIFNVLMTMLMRKKKNESNQMVQS
ncbi:M1-specific T cell receptor alpha chain-like isoform X1 [Falco biarmicus]|uniref:M1-specific T cell receptor alpha chain-like isoform X1 n=1 Tax=Falco cherrug TaxID=345164 RepID=UPI00247B1E68|nr:M1-specific T cell receptor alpha chain-like isoform X1 [Falco cherrug]XP_056194388.1 M1-specific T cell receptor alpha chain-like isoform X1 [Falco biarmicus]